MITKNLKRFFHTGEPVYQEFSALMNATFKYYADTHSLFFEKLPSHLHQSSLISLVNVDLKNRLFAKSFCEGIQDSLKSLRKVIIRLEDLQKGEPQIPSFVLNLTRLIAIAEQVADLYQRHWEYYRYKDQLKEEEIIWFLMEIDNIGKIWDAFQTSHTSVNNLLASISPPQCPEDRIAISITYQYHSEHPFSVSTLKNLMQFLETSYRFVCTVVSKDFLAQPISMIQVEVKKPVELLFSIPRDIEEPLKNMLQHMFLKDMLKKETLLKFVFESVQKSYGSGKPLTPAALTAFQKELITSIKELPEEAVFTIANRTFPDDGIVVLREFTDVLADKKINYDALLKAIERGKSTLPKSSENPGQQQIGLVEKPNPAQSKPEGMGVKDHISILTNTKS